MSVTRADVEHIARLARLALDMEELERFTTQLNAILEHVSELREVDVAGVEPFAIAAEGVLPPRADEPGADTLLHALDELSGHWLDGFFTVPRLDAQRDSAAEVS